MTVGKYAFRAGATGACNNKVSDIHSSKTSKEHSVLRIPCRLKQIAHFFGFLGAFLVAGPLSAQSYPSKPLRIISPNAAGGGTDTIARLMGSMLSEGLGQPVVVENRAGAGGSIGAEYVAKSPPDGYTLLVVPSAVFAINPHIYRDNLRYDPIKDFAPITIATNSPFMLVLHPSIPATNVKELIAYAKTRPKQLAYSSSGIGSSGHLSGVLFAQLAGIELVHVPYKGAAQGTTDLLAGQIQLRFSSIVPVLPLVKANKLRALGMTSAKRYAPLPDMPTIAESGLPGFVVQAWYGLAAPARTPTAIVTRLNSELVRRLTTEEIKARMTSEGGEVIASTPEQMAESIRSELALWEKHVRESGAKPE